MRPLSEELKDMLATVSGRPITVGDKATLLMLLSEAAARAKRYEDAPVVELTECNQIQGVTDYDWGDMQAAISPMKPGQRVRILLDTDLNPHQ